MTPNTPLALYIYPEPDGTVYTAADLDSEVMVERLFDYCQILRAVITPAGWDHLLARYGLEGLFAINARSGWIGADDLDDFREWLDVYRSYPTP